MVTLKQLFNLFELWLFLRLVRLFFEPRRYCGWKGTHDLPVFVLLLLALLSLAITFVRSFLYPLKEILLQLLLAFQRFAAGSKNRFSFDGKFRRPAGPTGLPYFLFPVGVNYIQFYLFRLPLRKIYLKLQIQGFAFVLLLRWCIPFFADYLDVLCCFYRDWLYYFAGGALVGDLNRMDKYFFGLKSSLKGIEICEIQLSLQSAKLKLMGTPWADGWGVIQPVGN